MARDLQEIFRMETSTLGELRLKISELKDALAGLKIGSEDQKRVTEELMKAQQQQKAAMSGVAVEAVKGGRSFNELNVELRRLKEAWKAAGDEAQRGVLTAQINAVKSQMNGMNESIGNYQHNVGNYTNSIIDAFSKMGLSIGGQGAKMQGVLMGLSGTAGKTEGVFKSLWATLSANPIGAVVVAVGVLVGAFSALSRAIHENEESEMRLHEAMSAFRPIKDGFKRWIDEMAQSFVAFTEKVSDAFNWLRKFIASYNDWRGLTDGNQRAEVEAEIEAYRMLAEQENLVVKNRRAINESNSSREARIAELREEATYAKDAAEKERLLTEAKRIQEKVNRANIALAEQELAVKKANAALTPNSTQVENELSEAQVKVNRARAEGARALRTLDRQLQALHTTHLSVKKTVNELADAERELADALRESERAASDAEKGVLDGLQKAIDLQQAEIEKRKTAMELEQEEYERKKALLEEYHLSTEELEKNHEDRLAEFRAEVEQREYEELMRQRAAEKAVDEQRTEEYRKLMKARQDATAAMASGTVSILKQMSKAMGESTKLGKGFAIAAATIDTIASAVAGFRAGMNQWADAGPMAWMGPVQAALNATAALVAGYAEVQQIRNVDTSGSSSGGGGSTAVALAIPNIEGLSSPMEYTRQVTTETEREEMNQGQRVYILESDIQESGRRVRVREEETTF